MIPVHAVPVVKTALAYTAPVLAHATPVLAHTSIVANTRVVTHGPVIAAGYHARPAGQVPHSTGLTEPYLVIDLPNSDEILKDEAFLPLSMDPDSLQHIYQGIKASSNQILSFKINLFLDRFINIVSSERYR